MRWPRRSTGGHCVWPSDDRMHDAMRCRLSAFPEALRQDVEAYASRAVSEDPFSDNCGRPVRNVTVVSEGRRIWQLASALVAAGVPIEEVTSLAVLVRPANARLALEWLYDRKEKKKTPHLANQAGLLVKLANKWVKSTEADIKVLRGYVSNLTEARSGMTEKNRDRLKQFRLRANQDALLRLPDRVFRAALDRNVGDVNEARRVMYGLAVEFLTVAPIRIKNLTELDLDEHLFVVRRGGEQTLYIKIPKQQTKTNHYIDIPLPDGTVRLLSIYLKTFRPLLCDSGSRALFPGRNGAIRNTSGFGQGIRKFIQREAGLVMNPHLFRGWSVDLLLERRPEAIETARRLLNHRHISTTLNYYADLKTEVAFREYDQILADRRRELEGAAISAKSRGSKR